MSSISTGKALCEDDATYQRMLESLRDENYTKRWAKEYSTMTNKMCFCKGPENCDDIACPLVERRKRIFSGSGLGLPVQA